LITIATLYPRSSPSTDIHPFLAAGFIVASKYRARESTLYASAEVNGNSLIANALTGKRPGFRSVNRNWNVNSDSQNDEKTSSQSTIAAEHREMNKHVSFRSVAQSNRLKSSAD